MINDDLTGIALKVSESVVSRWDYYDKLNVMIVFRYNCTEEQKQEIIKKFPELKGKIRFAKHLSNATATLSKDEIKLLATSRVVRNIFILPKCVGSNEDL